MEEGEPVEKHGFPEDLGDAVELLFQSNNGAKWGYIDILEKEVGQKNVRTFKRLGYIECGFSPDEERNLDFCPSWRITGAATKVRPFLKKVSLIDKIKYYFRE